MTNQSETPKGVEEKKEKIKKEEFSHIEITHENSILISKSFFGNRLYLEVFFKGDKLEFEDAVFNVIKYGEQIGTNAGDLSSMLRKFNDYASQFNQPPVSGGEVEFPLPEFELIKSRFEAGDYDLNDVIIRAFKLGQSKQGSGSEANRFEGWIECELPFLPSTGDYQVMDSDGNIFMCVYVDFGEDRGWQTDKYITSYRLEPLPTPPSK